MSSFKEQEFQKSFDFSLWKKIFAYAKPYKKDIFALAAVMIMVGSIDAIFPMMTKIAIDRFVAANSLQGIFPFGAVYFGLLVILAFNVYFLIAIAGKLEMNITYDIRKKGFEHLQELSLSYYDKTPVGWLMARMTSDIQRLGETISWGLVDSIWGFTMMIAMSIAMLILNFKLAIIALLVVPPLALISNFFQKKILKSYREVRKTNSQITGAFNEGIMGAKTTKTLLRENKNYNEFSGLTKKMFNSSYHAAILSSLFLPVVLTLGSIATGLILWIGGYKVFQNALSFGALAAFISYTIQFFDPITELARIFAEFQAASASAERVMSMVETQLEIKDSDRIIKKYGSLFFPKMENWEKLRGNVEFNDVSFRYKEGEQVLSNFNVSIKAGSSIALVGETGSGKSTIVNLICRFYEPTRGKILIDGKDYKERSSLWLHTNIGYVLQSPHLFSGTIKDNIRYGNLIANEKDIIEAAKLVNAHSFISKLEKGYDTEVGEGGARLSTGEKQLISFARAILSKPKIFILDEATSSVDTETEKLIQNAITKVLKGRTSFIIAHRLSTIKNSDKILVIDKGKIIEQGSHKELMLQRKHYYELYTNQYIEEKQHLMLSE